MTKIDYWETKNTIIFKNFKNLNTRFVLDLFDSDVDDTDNDIKYLETKKTMILKTSKTLNSNNVRSQSQRMKMLKPMTLKMKMSKLKMLKIKTLKMKMLKKKTPLVLNNLNTDPIASIDIWSC